MIFCQHFHLILKISNRTLINFYGDIFMLFSKLYVHLNLVFEIWVFSTTTWHCSQNCFPVSTLSKNFIIFFSIFQLYSSDVGTKFLNKFSMLFSVASTFEHFLCFCQITGPLLSLILTFFPQNVHLVIEIINLLRVWSWYI